MESLRCCVEQVVYKNHDNDYCVLQVSNDMEWNTIVGTMPGVNIGMTIIANGEWTNNKKFGRQFTVSTWHEELPDNVVGIEKYLASGIILGIGPKKARLIVSVFKEKTMEVMDNDIDRLLEVPSIGKTCLERIKRSWKEQKGVRDVMVFLQSHGISATYAAKIYKEYKNESIQKVQENPYCLADDIFGIGFKMADEIARSFGYERNDIRRCRSGVIYTLNQLAKDGHCYADMTQLISTANALLSADEDAITNAIDDMIANDMLIVDDNAVFLPIYYYSEVGVANKLKTLLKNDDDDIDPDDLDFDAISEDIVYDDIQKAAICEAMRSKVMVLTGLPGTGKSTTTNGIIAALEYFDKEVLCAAPTGRAAKRMTEVTGKEAKTIHRLLEYKPDEGFTRNEKAPLSGDVLIVDEASMIDIMLMNSLLKAVPDGMRLILVGDIDQLPSVGAGNVLRDIIDSDAVPVVRLTRIFRQAQTSRIVMNAHRVNHGEYPDVSNGRDSDFFFMSQDDPERCASEVVNLVCNRLPKAYGYNPSDIQVLVPMIKSVVGTVNLNILLQEAINPVGEFIQCGQYKYRVGDKVMQIRNDYEKNVFNGDIGVVEELNSEDRTMSVAFDKNIVEYESGELTELMLAYACTIHKSQGSEYPVVVMPLMMSHYIMLQRNLVYTGITRAKKLCVVIGDTKALGHAIRNVVVLKRNTRLKERLRAKS